MNICFLNLNPYNSMMIEIDGILLVEGLLVFVGCPDCFTETAG